MSNLQAAFGLGQLERVDQLIEAKRRIFSWYREGLEDVPGITLNHEDVMGALDLLDDEHPGRRGVRARPRSAEAHLREARIDTRPVFTPISQYPFWPRRQAAQPVATAIGARGDQSAERRHAAPRAGRPGVRRDPPGGGGRLAESGMIRPAADPAVVARTPGSDVLVALSVKDGERFLPEAIECVLAQEEVDLRLEIYDNGSDRPTRSEIARGYAAATPASASSSTRPASTTSAA